MTDRLTQEAREALIAGAVPGMLTPEQAADVALLARLLADPKTWTGPGAGLEDAVVRAVTSAAPQTVSPATSTEAVVTPLRRGGARRRRRGISPVLAAAAAAVVAIALVTGIAVARREVNPDFEADLTATSLAPGARASVEMYHSEAGFRVSLDARGLPGLPPGDYYQAWLRNAAGTLVPVGTFSSADGHVTLWSGVSPEDFPDVTVTIEATDGEYASSERRVLVGNVRAAGERDGEHG